MRNLLVLLVISVSISVRAAGIADGKPIHILTVGGQSFTNVVFEEVTDTHVFFQHAGGMSSLRLADLDPKLQKQLGYDPVKGAALLSAQAQAGAYNENTPVSLRKTTVTGAHLSATDTNSFKPPPGTVTKDFLIGKDRKLTLSFPNRWLDDSQPTGDATSPGIMLHFNPQSGSNFVVLVSTLSPTNSLAQVGSAGLMNMVAGECAARAVDKPLVQHLVGAEFSGDYFSFANKAYVDKEPKAGAYRFEMQGMVDTKDLCLYFTVLFNYKDGGEDTEILEMIRSARLSKEEERR